jgi:hypothetical protein
MRSFTYKVPQIEEGAILFEAENLLSIMRPPNTLKISRDSLGKNCETGSNCKGGVTSYYKSKKLCGYLQIGERL